MLARVNFLSEAQTYDVRLPDGVDPLPELHSVVKVDGGAREVVFEPSYRRKDPALDGNLSHLGNVAKGAWMVELYQFTGTPTYVAAFWRLSRGFLYTFLQDQSECGGDPAAGITIVLDNMAVAENAELLPTIAIAGSLGVGDPREPEQRDIMSFHPQPGAASRLDVQLHRLPPGGRGRNGPATAGIAAQVWARTKLGIEVAAFGPAAVATQLAAHANSIAASLEPSN
jgi:hypothetical protein